MNELRNSQELMFNQIYLNTKKSFRILKRSPLQARSRQILG